MPTENPVSIVVREITTREVNTLKNQLWYRGDPVELEQFYKQAASLDSVSGVSATRFWAASSKNGAEIRKIHSGLPRMIADKLAGIVTEDMNEPNMEQAIKDRWESVTKEYFDELLDIAVAATLSEGDGAFKICVDPTISDKPIIEFFAGNKVDFVYKRGILIEIIFYTDYWKQSKHFKLAEHYGKGYVRYKLVDDLNSEYPLDTLEETMELVDVAFEGDFMMAVPLKIYPSAKWGDRGESIFEGKGDMFDALDECVSTWMDAIRGGRVKQYIPDDLVPRNEDTGQMLKPDVFNPFYVKGTNLAEDSENKIEVIQGQIEYEGYLNTYITLLDCCLQGLISPSTLGIDVKKLDNAESQREKEKTTLYTRDKIIGSLAKVLPKLVEAVLKTEDTINGKMPPEVYESTFEWGQYANPSFEAIVETVGKAKTYGIMSIERCVEELYGDTMTEEDKAEEVLRLKQESTLGVDIEQPAVNDELNVGEVNAV